MDKITRQKGMEMENVRKGDRKKEEKGEGDGEEGSKCFQGIPNTLEKYPKTFKDYRNKKLLLK